FRLATHGAKEWRLGGLAGSRRKLPPRHALARLCTKPQRPGAVRLSTELLDRPSTATESRDDRRSVAHAAIPRLEPRRSQAPRRRRFLAHTTARLRNTVQPTTRLLLLVLRHAGHVPDAR